MDSGFKFAVWTPLHRWRPESIGSNKTSKCEEEGTSLIQELELEMHLLLDELKD
jgi:hypothetical protein